MNVRNLLIPSVCAALLAALLWSSCATRSSELGQSDLLLLYTSNVHGYIEPCGCVAGQIGGVDRIAAYVRDQREEHPDALWIDCGDLVSEEVEHDPATEQQLRLKARALFDVWGRTGCDAFALGDTEVALGILRTKTLAEKYGVPVICANLVDRDGEPVFPPYRILESGGKRIGVFSVLASNLQLPIVNQTIPVNVARMVAEQGYELQSWRERANEVAAELREQCDLVVFASHAGFGRNREFAAGDVDVDVIVGGHFGSSERETYWEDGTPVLVAVVRGSRVGRVEWWWRDEDAYFEERVTPVDVSEWVGAKSSFDVEDFAWRDLVGREEALGTEEWELERRHHDRERERHRHVLHLLGEPPAGNLFSHFAMPMHFGLPRSEMALDVVDEYHEDLKAFWTERGVEGMDPDKTRYVGPEACADCHTAQYEFWKSTRHSRAFSTLAATDQEMDAECIGCHTAGYQQPGGFQMPNRYPGRENVQCESCHGPARAHLLGGRSYVRAGALHLSGTARCSECHNHEHDPDFEDEVGLRLPLVTCPPLEAPGAGTLALREAYREIARDLSEDENPALGDVSLYLLKAGDLTGAVEAGEQWLAEDPRDLSATLYVARLHVTVGRLDEALEEFELVLRFRPHSVPALQGVSELVRETNPERALLLAQEAFSIRPDVESVRLLAEAYLAVSQDQGARQVLEAWIQSKPGDEAALADLFARTRD